MLRKICAKEGCEKTVDSVNGKYCSAAHAPFAGLSSRVPPISRQTVEFTTPEPGGPLVASWRGGSNSPRRTDSDALVRSGERKPPIENEKRTTPTEIENEPDKRTGDGLVRRSEIEITDEGAPVPKPTEPQSENETETGTGETENELSPLNTPEETDETLPGDSKQLSTQLDGETYRSMNLIDDSAKQLRELMHSIAPPSKLRDDAHIGLQTQRIQAACKCAQQMHNLLRLKVDLIREMRKADLQRDERARRDEKKASRDAQSLSTT